MQHWQQCSAGIADGQPKAKGVDLGKKAAADLIALRANDGMDAQETYRPHTARACMYQPLSTILHIRSGHFVGDGERLSISPACTAGAHLWRPGQGTLMKFVSSEGSIASNVRPSRPQSVGFGSLLVLGATMQSFDRSR